MALALIVRAMHFDGFSENEIVNEACDTLLAIRPQAAPNPLVLEIGLSLFLDTDSASNLLVRLVNHPELFQNRYKGASPTT